MLKWYKNKNDIPLKYLIINTVVKINISSDYPQEPPPPIFSSLKAAKICFIFQPYVCPSST